jgi:hypothetical protein
MYNWDKKGFSIKIVKALKYIISKKVYNNKQIRALKQDKSKEFISLLATICVNGTKLLLALIYKGALGDFQDTWVED